MSCLHNDFDGMCSYYNSDDPDPTLGCDEFGNCICEDDPSPIDTCSYYEDDESDDWEDDEDFDIEG